ncbi:galactoside 2-alpha-L-fucosyltransferase SEC1-like [Penaeus indicus]|uniref:galactoside 2-alpha-L-fucosyltransferase SEC1-like n=1 Tax=Penaeus indicus TaxID=29960 RepID=UPI00300D853C
MAGTRCNLHRLFAALLLISSLSLVFLFNLHDFVLEVRQGPYLQRSNAGGQDEKAAAKESLSDAEEALLEAYSGKDQKPGQIQGQGEVKAQVLQPPKPEVKVLQPPAKILEPPAKVLQPLQSQVPAPPEPPPMPKNAPEPPKGKPESPMTSEKTLEPPGPTKKSSEKPSKPTALGPRQTSAPKPATSKPKAVPEWVNKSANCLPLPGTFHVVPIPQEDCNEPHVVMHAGGQLGNKMCQYISLYLLRHIYGVRVSITPRMKEVLSWYFVNVSLPIQDPECFTKDTLRITFDDLYLLLQSRASSKSSGIGGVVRTRLMDRSYYIYHHPCPRDVIMAHRNLVRSVLAFKEEVLTQARSNLQEALHRIRWPFPRDNTTVVSVHVRRRDYTTYILKHYNLTQLDETYFRRAFQHFRDRVVNPVFVVVSDDHSWCHKVLEGGDVVVAGSQKNPVNDIALLSLGDHTIISYGTFSFMGATLAQGKIAHPVNNNDKYSHYDCVDDPAILPINRDTDDSPGPVRNEIKT